MHAHGTNGQSCPSLVPSPQGSGDETNLAQAGYCSVCTKGSNFNMADTTGGQLESTVRVSNVGAKGFEPSTG